MLAFLPSVKGSDMEPFDAAGTTRYKCYTRSAEALIYVVEPNNLGEGPAGA